MPLPTPDLDDRTFEQLVAGARRRVEEVCPAWSDLSPHDPGMVLVELFAFLTETMLYRLNRLPDKAFIEFLRLMGVTLTPPAAARATLRFQRVPGHEGAIAVRRGTRVTASRSDGASEEVVFATADDLVLSAGADEVEGIAFHGELVEAELLGTGNGRSGQTFRLRRPPVVAPTGDDRDLVVAVEVGDGEPDDPDAPSLEVEGRTYRVWREVGAFADAAGLPVYRADRQAGLVSFAPSLFAVEDGRLDESPSALAAVPPAGREVRAWYRRGGGAEGNVPAGALTTLKDPRPGVTVTNPAPATGGRRQETLDNARGRGPQQIHSLQRAVTARDFELVALAADRALARAQAVASASFWRHATPGEAEVVIVPARDVRPGERVSADAMRSLELPLVAETVLAELDRRRPLGSRCRVSWAQYKTVRVSARVVIHRHEDRDRIERRVLERLYGTLAPLAPGEEPGWPFGRTLRASHVYEIALREAGVLWVDGVRLWVDEVPDDPVTALASVPTQEGVWFAATGDRLFRTLNDGDGWEPVAVGSIHAGEAEEIVQVCVHPARPGLVAVVTRFRSASHPSGLAPDDPGSEPAPADPGRTRSRLYLSRTTGESWLAPPTDLGVEVERAAWFDDPDTGTLLLATDAGLYRLDADRLGAPDLVVVDPARQDLPLYAVTSARGGDGHGYVAVAARERRGVFLASRFRDDASFRRIDDVAQGRAIAGEDVRVLEIQAGPGALFLWAGTTGEGPEDLGDGCFRWYLRGDENPPQGWEPFGEGWRGGSCLALAFLGPRVLAASYRRGVHALDTTSASPIWTSALDSGLPRTNRDDFPVEPVPVLAARESGRGPLALAGTRQGVFAGRDGVVGYREVSTREFHDRVTLPPGWLFCSGRHDIEVVREEEAGRAPRDPAPPDEAVAGEGGGGDDAAS